MPPVHRDGAQVGTEHRPDALNATTTVSITPRPAKGRRRRAAKRRKAMTARVSLLAPDEHRTWWHYLFRCPTCGRPHLGRSRELAGVTGTRRLPCRHWVVIVVARSYGQMSPGAAA